MGFLSLIASRSSTCTSTAADFVVYESLAVAVSSWWRNSKSNSNSNSNCRTVHTGNCYTNQYRSYRLWTSRSSATASMASELATRLNQQRSIHIAIKRRKASARNKEGSNKNGNNSSDKSSVDETTTSARKLFQQIPVHTSIIEYIRTIGVGIPPRRDTLGRRNIRFSYKYANNNTNTSSNIRGFENDNYDTAPANSKTKARSRLPQEERKQLKKRKLEENRQQQQQQQRQQLHQQKENDDNDDCSNDHRPWIPPPPFGPKSLPVQIIASVGPETVQESELHAQDGISTPEHKHDERMPITNAKTAYPKNLSQIPEIAIIGRSNVGKSTLLNALLYGNCSPHSDHVIKLQHKQYGHVPNNMKLPKGIKAVTSTKPGETRHITFYKLQHITEIESSINTTSNIQQQEEQPQRVQRSLMLVDLPGYGFAYAKERDTMAYRKMMLQYLLQRGKSLLQRVLLLIDARHGMKKADIDFLLLLEDQHTQNIQQQQTIGTNSSNVSRQSYTLPFPIQIVLTKCDLVVQNDLARRVTQVRQQLSDVLRREPGQLPIMLVSARAGIGYNNVILHKDQDHHQYVARGGIFELQKELAGLAYPVITSK